MASLQESLNRFKQQQQKCQSTLKSISCAAPSSNTKAAAQQPPHRRPHTAATSFPVGRPAAAAVKFSNDTERLQHITQYGSLLMGGGGNLILTYFLSCDIDHGELYTTKLCGWTRDALTPEEIYNGCYVNVYDNKNEIFDSLRNNPKVSFDGKRFSYKAKHDLKGKDDLLSLIKRDLDGLPVVDVKDSYFSVMDDLMALKNENLVWLDTSIDSQEDIVYPNNFKDPIKTDEDVKTAYFPAELHRDFVDTEKELVKMGMKPATKTAERRAAAQVLGLSNLSKSKAKKKHNRKFSTRKLTNVHMQELFQFNDFELVVCSV